MFKLFIQLQHVVQDEVCIQFLDLHEQEMENNATGGAVVSQSRRANAEAAYQRKAEHMGDENCYKISVSQVCTVCSFAYLVFQFDNMSPRKS